MMSSLAGREKKCWSTQVQLQRYLSSLKISSSVSSLINQNIRNLYIYSETQVESPLSPHNSSAPASLSQGVAKALQGLHLEEQAGLLIEEVLLKC